MAKKHSQKAGSRRHKNSLEELEDEITNIIPKPTIRLNTPFKWTTKQKDVINTILDDKTNCVFINGEAGTGKTHLSLYSALKLLQEEKIENIIYVRSIVESTSTPQGFLPGTAKEKEAPYMEIMVDTIGQILDPQVAKQLLDSKVIKGISNSFIRGVTMRKSMVIVDESQNYDMHGLKSLISRIGEGSKIVFLFDPGQSDLRNKHHRNDITRFSDVFKTRDSTEFGIFYKEFTVDDIMRSPFCKFVMTKLKAAGI